jgi:hypothetical protein
MSLERIALVAIAIAAVAYSVSQFSRPSTAVAATPTNIQYSIGGSTVIGSLITTWILDQTNGQIIYCHRDNNGGAVNCVSPVKLPNPL